MADEAGVAGLVPKMRGPRGPRRLQGGVLAFVEAQVLGEPIRARALRGEEALNQQGNFPQEILSAPECGSFVLHGTSPLDSTRTSSWRAPSPQRTGPSRRRHRSSRRTSRSRVSGSASSTSTAAASPTRCWTRSSARAERSSPSRGRTSTARPSPRRPSASTCATGPSPGRPARCSVCASARRWSSTPRSATPVASGHGAPRRPRHPGPRDLPAKGRETRALPNRSAV
jgi:hypothetical protein